MGGSGLCGCSLILILIHHSHACKTVDKDLCIEETKKTWGEASESCTLVVSNTSLRVGVPITDIPVLRHRSSAPTYTSKDVHWIGATGTFSPWFELAGCNQYFYFPFNKQWIPSSKIGPVAQCHQLCENWRNSYKEFGINDTHCFCAEDNNKGVIKNMSCNLNNSKNVENDIIGTDYDQRTAPGYYVFAWYKKVKLSIKIDDTLGECLLETNKGNKTYPCDAADVTQRTWVERYRNEIKTDSRPRWTPYVRRLIISWKKDNSAEQKASACIGVLNQNGAYEPSPRPCNESLTSICRNENIMTGTTTPRTIRSSYGTSWEQTTFGHQVTDSSPVDRQNDSNDTPASTLPLIIGSAVGGLLCIVLVGIIIVIFLKRRRPNKKENPHPAPSENVYYSEMKEDKKSQLTMEKEEPSPTVDSTDYDTMMSVNKEKITHDSEEYGKLLPNGEADVYNHTWDKPITEQLTDHVYSSTISGNDVNVYDHTVTSNTELTKDSKEKRSILNGMEDNLYDHTDTNNTELTKVSDENRELSTGNN